MDEEQSIRFETVVQELLAGELGQAETADLLGRIAEDDNARQILADMLALQQRARQACGYDVQDEAIRAALVGTLSNSATPS